LELVDYRSIPPLWANTQAIIGAYIVAGKLAFDMRYDQSWLNDEEAGEIMDLFVSKLEAMAVHEF
jgi:hypothetical protein